MAIPSPAPARKPRPRPPGRLSGGSRENVLKVRFDDEEFAIVRDGAKARNCTPARHLRDLAVADAVRETAATHEELGRLILMLNTFYRNSQDEGLRISPAHGEQLLTLVRKRLPDFRKDRQR